MSLDAFSLDVLPFAALPAGAVVWVFVTYGLGFFIRGMFGFGSNMPIVLLTAWVLGPRHAIVLVALTAAFAQVQLFPQSLKTADWHVTRPLLAGMLAGTAVGVWGLSALAADWLTMTMGLLVASVVLMDRYRLIERLAARVDLRDLRITSALAMTSGTLGTISGGGTMYFLVAYLRRACATPESLRGTNLALSGLFLLVRVLFIAVAGLIAGNVVAEAVLLLPAVFLGTWAGTRFFKASSPERFYSALQALLVGAAIVLFAKGLSGFV